ncbi:MAG: hypothetical protein U0T02_05245 [Solirubrobacteraceae bacterium]
MAAGPDLPGVVAALSARGARHVVIGGFAVIAHQFIRATEDVDVLVPDDPDNDARLALALEDLGARLPGGEPATVEWLGEHDHARLESAAHGLVDVVREGVAPLDFASVQAGAVEGEVQGVAIRVAGLASLVALKRLAGRPRDRLDLEELAARHGELPIVAVPGLDPGA